MKYKLYTEKKYNSPIEQVLRGRGIDDVRGWLDADMSIVSPFSALKNTGVEDVKEAILESLFKTDNKGEQT